MKLPYGEPAWNTGRFHSIDFGVEFDLDDGMNWVVIWQQESWNEALGPYLGTIRTELVAQADVTTWDVSHDWHARFAGPVTSADAVWTTHRWGPAFTGTHFDTQVDEGRESDYCLVTVVLRSDHETAVINWEANTTELSGTSPTTSPSSFRRVRQARAGVLLPADPDAIP